MRVAKRLEAPSSWLSRGVYLEQGNDCDRVSGGNDSSEHEGGGEGDFALVVENVVEYGAGEEHRDEEGGAREQNDLPYFALESMPIRVKRRLEDERRHEKEEEGFLDY